MLGLDIFLFLCSMFLLFFCFYFQQEKKKKKKKKKKGEKDADFLFPYLDFQISYVILCDVSVLGALIILAFI
jgi:low temperature requirement protein LtrA